MAIVEFLNTLKVSSTDKLSKIEDEAQAIKAQVTEIEQAEADYQAEIAAAEAKGFDQGLAQAGQLDGDGKIYSDAEMIQFIAEAVAPKDAEIAALTEQVSTLQATIDGHAALVETAKTEAVAAFKAEMLAQYEAQQVAESTSETGFAELLK